MCSKSPPIADRVLYTRMYKYVEEHENELRNDIMNQGRGVQLAGEKPGNELNCTELRACHYAVRKSCRSL